MKKLFQIFALLLSILLIISILLAYISVWISPERIWILAFFGLSYPYFLIGNLFFFFYWIFRKKKLSLLILIVILLGFNHFNSYIPIIRKDNKVLQSSSISGPEINILSYNVRMFNLFEKEARTAEKTLQFINQENTDIICLQEVLISNYYDFNLASLKKHLKNTPYLYIQYLNNQSKDHHYGLAIFSKYPIINKGRIEYKNANNLSLFVDLLVGHDTLRIYNNHLQSFRLGSDNLKFLTNFEEAIEDPPISEVKDISSKMKSAYVKRSRQARELSAHIQTSPYSVIVCGDFNDTPVSYTYRKIKNNMKDAFIESGKGLGKTYSQIIPSYRIDYILHSDRLVAYDFRTMKEGYSDHYPIRCSFLLNKTGN